MKIQNNDKLKCNTIFTDIILIDKAFQETRISCLRYAELFEYVYNLSGNCLLLIGKSYLFL